VWDDGEKRLINGGVCYRELPRRAAIA
jgi:hypothetical protein